MVVGTCHLQGRQPLLWGRSPVSFGQINLGLVFQGKSWDKGPCSLDLPRIVHYQWPVALDTIWHIYSHLYCSSSNGGRDLPSSGEAAPTMGRFPVSFEQIGQPSFFSQQLLMWFGTFTCTCTAPWRMVVGTCHLQGRHPLSCGRSPVNFGQISLGLVFQSKSWDKGPSSHVLPRMLSHQCPAAPDMI